MVRADIEVEVCRVEDAADAKAKAREKSRSVAHEVESEEEEDYDKLPDADDDGPAETVTPSRSMRSGKRLHSELLGEEPPPSPSRRKTT